MEHPDWSGLPWQLRNVDHRQLANGTPSGQTDPRSRGKTARAWSPWLLHWVWTYQIISLVLQFTVFCRQIHRVRQHRSHSPHLGADEHGRAKFDKATDENQNLDLWVILLCISIACSLSILVEIIAYALGVLGWGLYIYLQAIKIALWAVVTDAYSRQKSHATEVYTARVNEYKNLIRAMPELCLDDQRVLLSYAEIDARVGGVWPRASQVYAVWTLA